MQAQRPHYKVKALLDRQGTVSTYQALDVVSNEPVLYYQFSAEPIDNAKDILSDNILDVLNVQYMSGITHVFTVQPSEKQPLKHRLEDSQLEPFLLDTARALEAAYDAGVVHGDIRPKRMFFDGSNYLIEGYGVRWELLLSRYTPPEKYQSSSGDVYSWAKTMGAFIPLSIPSTIADLLKHCLAKEPKHRPTPKAILKALKTFSLENSKGSDQPTSEQSKMVNLKESTFGVKTIGINTNGAQQEILTNTQERFIKAMDILKQANKKRA